MTENVTTIYTDGACSGNPGPGGWGAVIITDGGEQELFGSDPETTNNRMELMAAIQALESLNIPSVVTLYSDSQYVINGITKWLPNWKKRSWKTASGAPVKNQDLWQRLEAAKANLQVTFRWIKGHSGVPGNERADALAANSIS